MFCLPIQLFVNHYNFKSLVCHVEPSGPLGMNPTTVGKILQEIAGSHAHLHHKGLYIVDLEYNTTGGYSGHENGSFSHWAQITEASFNVLIWVSQSVSVVEDIPNRL